MKITTVILAAVLCLPCAASAASQRHVIAKVPPESRGAVEGAVGSALAPLGFKRDTKSVQEHPINLLQGLVAMYVAGTYADASIFEVSGSGCFYIAVDNYDEARAGLLKAAELAIQRNLRATFGKNVAFFADAQCTMRSNISVKRTAVPLRGPSAAYLGRYAPKKQLRKLRS